MTNAELDRAVAVEVMGWTERHDHTTLALGCHNCKWVDPNATQHERDWALDEHRIEDGYEGEAGFRPSTDWRSAGAVIERLAGAGFWVHFRPDGSARLTAPNWTLESGGLWLFDPTDRGDTPLRALCLAALAAARAGALGKKA